MKISVVIPVFKRSNLLGRAVKSVFSQVKLPFELIVFNDGRNELTEKAVLQLFNMAPIETRYLYSKKVVGVSRARNEAVKIARGDWIAFLDSDDEWLAEKLAWQQEIYLREGLNLVHGEEIWMRGTKKIRPKALHKKSGGELFLRSLDRCLVSPSAVLINKSTFMRLGGFREDFLVCEDYDLWLRYFAHERCSFVEKPVLIKYGGHLDQLSERYRGLDWYRIQSLEWIAKNLPLDSEKKEALEAVLKKKQFYLLAGKEKRADRKGDEIFCDWAHFKMNPSQTEKKLEARFPHFDFPGKN